MKSTSISVSIRSAVGLVLLFSLAFGNIYVVSADGPRCYVKAAATPPGTGISWGTAYPDLQTALGNAACTEVWVAAGTYKPTSGTDYTVSFVLKNGVAIYGGFAGTEALLDQRNPAVNQTILSGDIGDVGNSDNSYHVVVGSGTNNTALLDGFTITNGYADGTWPDTAGGGMFNDGGSPSLANITFTGNEATALDGVGGGMFNKSSSPILQDVIFSENEAYYGGGMYNQLGSNPQLTNVLFINNSGLYAATGGGGGGMSNNTSNPVLTNVTFSGNMSDENGGGMANFDSTPTLTNVTFNSNSAIGQGGGLYNWKSSPVLTNVTFSGNAAHIGGAIANYEQSAPILFNVTFRGNTAVSSGGGMYNVYTSSPTLVNVTFSSNSAASGGGISNEGSSLLQVKNSILYGDTGGEITGEGVTVTYSIVQGGYTGTGNLDANPVLKPLGDYGGFTQTMPLDPGSPAIDKGTNTGCPSTDQREVARPQDGDGNGTAICDMGATESPRLYLKTFQSNAVQDGWVAESGENSGVGGLKNNASDTLLLGDLNQKSQILSILSFDTSSLPDNAVITQVMVKVKKAGQVGPADPFTILGNVLLDVRKGVFSGNAALQITDFRAVASKNAALTIKNPPVGGWYTGSMGAANLIYINTSGITQFRLRFAKDDNNDLAANELKLYSGNMSNAANRPKLIIKYYLP